MATTNAYVVTKPAQKRPVARLRNTNGSQKPNNNRPLKKALVSVEKLQKRTKIMTRLSWLAPFYPLQLILAAMFLISIGFAKGAEKVPFGIGDVAGETAIAIGFGLCLLFGICTMLVGVFLLTGSGINCFRKNAGIIFILALFFYCVPGLNLFPWVYWWGWNVGGE